jgi:hypothetical protein
VDLSQDRLRSLRTLRLINWFSLVQLSALDEVLYALQKLPQLLPAASVRDGANVELIACLWLFSARSAPENKKQADKRHM